MNYAQLYSDWVKGNPLDEIKPEQRRALPLIVSGAASPEQLEAAGLPFVVGIKAAAAFSARPTVTGPIEKARQGEHVIPWVLSDASPDRMGDVINPDGWHLKNFRANPVIMWGHGGAGILDGDEPIGRAENVRVEKGRLIADIRFAVEESERAARKFKLANSGYIKAGSVGFKPVKVERVEDEEERTKLGLGRFGVHYKEQELLEFSLVAVPANPHALQQSVKAGEIAQADADWLNGEVRSYTERDLERAARRKAAGLQPEPAPEPENRLEVLRKLLETVRQPTPATAQPELLVFVEHTREFYADLLRRDAEERAKSSHEIAEALHALASVSAMHAKAITDFCGCLSALRAGDPVPGADAPRSPQNSNGEVELQILQAIEDIFRRTK